MNELTIGKLRTAMAMLKDREPSDPEPLKLFSSGPVMTEYFREIFPGVEIVECATVGIPTEQSSECSPEISPK